MRANIHILRRHSSGINNLSNRNKKIEIDLIFCLNDVQTSTSDIIPYHSSKMNHGMQFPPQSPPTTSPPPTTHAKPNNNGNYEEVPWSQSGGGGTTTIDPMTVSYTGTSTAATAHRPRRPTTQSALLALANQKVRSRKSSSNSNIAHTNQGGMYEYGSTMHHNEGSESGSNNSYYSGHHVTHSHHNGSSAISRSTQHHPTTRHTGHHIPMSSNHGSDFMRTNANNFYNHNNNNNNTAMSNIGNHHHHPSELSRGAATAYNPPYEYQQSAHYPRGPTTPPPRYAHMQSSNAAVAAPNVHLNNAMSSAENDNNPCYNHNNRTNHHHLSHHHYRPPSIDNHSLNHHGRTNGYNMNSSSSRVSDTCITASSNAATNSHLNDASSALTMLHNQRVDREAEIHASFRSYSRSHSHSQRIASSCTQSSSLTNDNDNCNNYGVSNGGAFRSADDNGGSREVKNYHHTNTTSAATPSTAFSNACVNVKRSYRSGAGQKHKVDHTYYDFSQAGIGDQFNRSDPLIGVPLHVLVQQHFANGVVVPEKQSSSEQQVYVVKDSHIRNIENFPKRLFNMVSDESTNDAIEWLPHGRGERIMTQEKDI